MIYPMKEQLSYSSKKYCEMAEAHQTVKLAGICPPKNNNPGKQKPVNNNETPVKYCHNYNESGECRFGASCIYSRAKDPNHTTREPRAKITLEAKSHPPNQVGKDHRSPNGGEKFKGGYKGKNPKVKFNKVKQKYQHLQFLPSNHGLTSTKNPSSLPMNSSIRYQ